jgi:valyl-tRNA synthetase
MRISEDKIKGYKNFANKLWNITRYILTETEGCDRTVPLTEADAAIKAELAAIAKDVTLDINEHRIYLAAEKLYHFAWSRLADQLIEESKAIFAGDDELAKASRKVLLLSLLTDLLKLLHPFMPFVTEEIWKSVRRDDTLLMVSSWPAANHR